MLFFDVDAKESMMNDQAETGKSPALTVVIPVYNEKETLHEILQRVEAIPMEIEILMVDDGSQDGTTAIIRDLAAAGRVRAIYHEVNRGKGASLRSAFPKARGDIVVVQDADLEYNPRDLPELLEPILEGQADVVYGSRFRGKSQRVHLFSHRIANAMLTLFSNLLTNLNLTDMECGYKLFKKEVLENLPLRENRFGIEPEITAKIARRKYRIYEVPITYAGRDYSAGKKIGLKDAFRALWCILRYRIAD